MSPSSTAFEDVAADLRACRLCRDAPAFGPPLPVEPRPIVQGSRSARLCIASQAPGNRAFRSGVPFQDPSGIRLRDWLGLDEAAFYDASRLAIVPMGACFPGHDAQGGDLPPRRECAPRWREALLAGLPRIELILVIGQYAQAWHLGRGRGLTETVRDWRAILDAPRRPRVLPLPHPSWRNSGWLKRHPWFEAELLPVLREEVARVMAPPAALTEPPSA
ncbi:uracil-DNA glycosylase family protein [Methylobacterium organophilum]|uniref:uracil-DNA glycosylase family protein n=1 Tax=Methylobacterium organophilum TaxID=410 RepID=UPI001F130278|nr:uracil-DNA glycosylase family protein [Methylobacterium organophilum]UMY19399.1 uracil-DNA glycosylase family protein [Methylobacterium organophilum]